MLAKLLTSLHVVGACTLWTSSVTHLVTHPLSVNSSAISIATFCLGLSILLQELSVLFPAWTWCRWHRRSSYLGLAFGFLLIAAVTFDTLTGLACHIEAGLPPDTTSAANGTTTPGEVPSSDVKTLSRTRAPPVFGTAFYLSSSLAPHCIKLDGVPGQAAGSAAWVNIEVNQTSRLLVLVTCACTLAVSIVYFVLAMLNSSGKVGLSPGMASTRRENSPCSSQSIKPFHEPVEEGASTSSAYRIDMDADTSALAPRSASLYQENVLADAKQARALQSDSSQSDSTSLKAYSIPLIRRIRKTNPSQVTDSTLDPTQAITTTPEQGLHDSRVDSGSIAARTTGDVYARPDPHATTEPNSGVTPGLWPQTAQQRRERYGYEYGYDRAVDFASGCIMHYPIFTHKRKRTPPASSVGFPTLLPPDFSRTSTSSPTGLSPRKVGKSRSRVSSKVKDTDGRKQKHKEEQIRDACHDCGVVEQDVAVTESPGDGNSGEEMGPLGVCQESADTDQRDTLNRALSQKRVMSSSGIEELSQPSTDHKDTKDSSKPPPPPLPPLTQRLAMGQVAQRRLGTAESGGSMLSTFSAGSRCPTSRPGTATSTKSASSLRVMPRRCGLPATLDQQLSEPLNGLSQDVVPATLSPCSYDSQRSCSAGTFGDGTTTDSPLSTTRSRLALPQQASASSSSSSTSAASARNQQSSQQISFI